MAAQPTGFIELLNRWGEAHWHFAAAMFVQAGLLIVVLLCVDVLLLRRVRAGVRYAVWSLVLVKLMLPVSLHTPLSVSRWLPELQTAPSVEPADAVAVHQASALDTAWNPVEVPLATIPTEPAAEDPLSAGRATNSPAAVLSAEPSAPSLEPAPVTVEVIATEPVSVASREALRWEAYLLLTWLAVATVLTVMWVRRTLLVRRIVARSVAAPTDLESLLRECLQLAAVSGRGVRLRISEDLGSPAICGLRTATILLPCPLLDRLDRRRLRFVIVHELAHWRRWDLQVNCLQTVLQIAYFYNPLVWAANTILRRVREQAVDEAVLVILGSPREQYSSTLLDIASSTRHPAELAVRLVGVVESGKALGGRIRRILAHPVPRSARLGIVGMAAVLLTGLFLLPMAATHEPAAVAETPATPPLDEVDAESDTAELIAVTDQDAASDEAVATNRVLYGRITDEAGAPVTDAEITIFPAADGRVTNATTDADGRYSFSDIPLAGDYQIQVTSKRCVGISSRDRRTVTLLFGTEHEQNFVLPPACRLKVRTVDEEGNPVSGVRIMALLADRDGVAPDPVLTDREGWATLGGLVPSKTRYIVGTWHDDYGFERLDVTLDDPEQVPTHEFVLRAGRDITGTAVCSDGKPPEGWRILALPTWWHFGRYPNGTMVDEEGGFTLRHIVPGKYTVTIAIPNGENGSSPRPVLQDADLWETEGPLAVKLDYPSPASLVYIEGRVRIAGPLAERGFWIFASSADRQTHSSTYFRKGNNGEFRIGPVPPGDYTLRVEAVGIEQKRLQVSAPADDVELEVTVTGRPRLSGEIVDAATNEPVTDFRVRVIKLRTLSGPNFVEDSKWRPFQNEFGAFETNVAGPGIYQVLVAADGFAWTQSESVNTVEDGDKTLQIALTRGASLSGMVVDEQGNAVDGATVIPLSRAIGASPGGPDVPPSYLLRMFAPAADDGVETVHGRFELPHLLPGEDILKVTHPDYCFAIVPHVIVGPDRGDEPLQVTLTRGATVRGHVYDAQGRPEPGVTLFFQDDAGYSGNTDEDAGRFATAVTDADGYYEVQHLPEQICYVHRANEWEAFGVVRHSILPENGRTHTLDFGGKSELTGRLLINGVPLAGGRLLLSGENPNFGLLKAYAQTASDGSFTFRGLPPGNRTLYYLLPGRRNDWGRVQDIRVRVEGADLGEINHLIGSVTAQFVPPITDDDVRVTLQEFDPVWTFGNPVGSVSRPDSAGPFVIAEVPTGTYELICDRPGQFQVRQLVEVTPDRLQQQLTIRIPAGTASLSGHVDEEVRSPGSALKVWSADGRLRAYIIPQDDGSYRLENIPAGEYLIRDKDTRNAPALLEVSLRDGEQRTLDLTPENVQSWDRRPGFLEVHVYTSEGVPLPCDVVLEGPAGRLTPHSKQYGRVSFFETPGTYKLVVGYPGFETFQRSVELKPVNEEGRPEKGYSVQVRLERRPG